MKPSAFDRAGMMLALTVAVVLGGCGGGGGGGGGNTQGSAPGATLSCTTLAGMTFGDARITTAASQSVATPAGAVSFCEVRAQIGAQMQFALRLPVGWSGRYVHIGGGAWDGEIQDLNSDTLAGALTALSRGDAVGGSNGGHIGNAAIPGGPSYDTTWALNNFDLRVDYAWRAIGKMDVPARAIINAYYGRLPQRSYFAGCSTGGRDAIAAAIHYGENYDGVISGAPAINSSGSNAARITIYNHTRIPGNDLGPTEIALLEQKTLAACDALDGVRDGIISNPAACTFDPASLRCSAGGGGACLTDGQIQSMRLIRGGTRLADGTLLYPGYGIGAESPPDGLEYRIMSGKPNLPLPSNFLFVDGLLQNFVYSDPTYSSASFVLEKNYADILNAQLAIGMQVVPADMTAFVQAGKKFILWHGEGDYNQSVNESIRFYEGVVAAAGGPEAAAKVARLHVLPGVQHCGSGPGATGFDKVAAIADWVEQGKPPETLIATRPASGGTLQLTRPLCAYPRYPKYLGTGDPNLAESFTCALP